MMNSGTKNAATTASDASTLRSIRIVRNEAGYGFTLSRYIIFYEENVASAATASNDASSETSSQSSKKTNKISSNPAQRTFHSSIREAPSSSSRETLVNTALDNKNDQTSSSEPPKRKYDVKLKQSEVVFVKHVRVGSAAYLAGLREGDRLISINNISLSDKTYSDIIMIIENSGNTLDLNVTTSSSTSIEPSTTTTSSDAASAKKKSKSLTSDLRSPLNDNDESSNITTTTNDITKTSTINVVAGKTSDTNTSSSMSSNSQEVVKNEANKTLTNRTTDNSNDISKILQYGGGENLKPRNSNLGFSSLGMSALFYSFLKNNNSNSSAKISPPNSAAAAQQVKSGRPPLIETPSIDNDDANRMLNSTSMNMRASPLTQQKLRNLQEAIVKQYPKEQLTSLGVVIPNVASFDLGFTSSDEISSNKPSATDQTAVFSPSPSPSSQERSIEKQQQPSSVLLTDAQKPQHSKLEDQNNKISEWFHSLNRKNSYNEKHQNSSAASNNNKNLPSKSKAPTRYLRGDQDSNYLGARSSSNNEQNASGQSTPVSIRSTNSLVDSTSSTLSRNALLTSPTNSESTIFNEDDSMQNESMIPNSSNYGLAAANQKTPLEFSRYIKCVHKALNENDTNTKRGYFSANELDSDQRHHNPYDYLEPDEIDYLKTESSQQTTNQENMPVKPTRIVENRRQVFEKSHSMSSSTKPPDPQSQPQHTQTKSVSPVKMTTRPVNEPQQRKHVMSDGPSSHRSSVGEASDSSKTTPNSQGSGGNQLDSNKTNSNQTKKRTGDECRQIMSRANIETVAERAAHFEDVDFEKFNRLKSKLDEYDWYPDQEQSQNPIDKQKLRMLLYGYKDQNNNNTKSMGNEAFYNNYERYLNSLQQHQKQDPAFYESKNLYENGYPKNRDNEMRNESTLRYDPKSLNKVRSVSQSDQTIWNDYDDKCTLNKSLLAGGSTKEFNRQDLKGSQQYQDDKKRNMISRAQMQTTPNVAAAATQVQREKNYFFHDPSPIARSANIHQRNKGDSDMISTDSDIGTSPSGTTFASQPSSPQQINPSADNSPSYPESYNLYNFFADYANKRIIATPKSTINSDLSSIMESTDKNNIKHTSPDYYNPNQALRQGYIDIVDHLQGLSIASKKQLDEILNENEFILNQKFFGNTNDPYYFSPSSTLMRQQKLLQLKQSLQKQQHKESSLDNSTLKKDNIPRAKSNPRGVILLEQMQAYNKMNEPTQYSYDERKIMPYEVERLRKAATESVLISSNKSVSPENLDNKGTAKKDTTGDFSTSFGTSGHHDNSHKHFKKLFASSFQPTKNSSIRKLKYFFGEKFHPVILQAVENKNIIASDEYLSRIFETIREGVLNCKILLKEGKRSNDRSWRPAWAVLKSNGALFLCKEKKDNIMIPSVDSYPIDLKNCDICIAYDYNKRKNVFKLNTINNYEYLFQAVDFKSMSEWIKALQVYSRAQEASGGGSSSLVSTDSSASSSMRRLESSMSPLNKFITHQQTIASSDLISTPEELFYQNYEQQQQHQHHQINSPMKKPNLVVGITVPVNEELVSRRDPNNKKWMRQMTKRLKGFVSSSSFVDFEHQSGHNELMNLENGSSYERKNFGLPLEKCEQSSFSQFVPVVVEICTRLIELHINDEGLYRKVGQKQMVYFLRNQLDNGVVNIDVNDSNWNNPHVVVSLLKCFLNELPDSLATYSLYGELLNACQVENHQMRLFSIKQLLNRFPPHNYETLKYICAHLRRVAAAYYYNKMTIKNISISFSQSIVRHNLTNCEQIRSDHIHQCLLVELCLVYYEWLFDLSMSKNVPAEVKEPIEEHLFQTLYSNQERINYADLLINIIEMIRSSHQQQQQNDQLNYNSNSNSKKTLNINIKSLVRD